LRISIQESLDEIAERGNLFYLLYVGSLGFAFTQQHPLTSLGPALRRHLVGCRRFPALANGCAVGKFHSNVDFPSTNHIRSTADAHRFHRSNDGVRFWSSQSNTSRLRRRMRRPSRVTPGTRLLWIN